MERLTHERNNGIKTGYWSPNKKDELVSALAAYENTGLTPEQIISIATELKEYKQLGLSPKRLSEHVAFCRRYHELFGAIDFNQLLNLKERDTAKAIIRPKFGLAAYYHEPSCPNCGREFTPKICGYTMPQAIGYFDFCPWCGQKLKRRG